MRKLMKETFELWSKMRWVGIINKERKKKDKLYSKYKRQEYIVSNLIEEYQRKYLY